jgi:L-ascorbate metabolism protein UlaG (beta-lactamase superfamily)
VRIRLIRNATLVVELADTRLLVDPMLDPAGARPPVQNTANPRRNPLVGLPVPPEEVVSGVDAVVVTHLHQDHFDATAAELVADRLPVLCQPEDAETLRGRGVTRLTPVEREASFGGVTLTRTPARHGFGATAEALGPVSGFVLAAGGESLYVAGDTVFCDEVASVLAAHRPRAVVVNAAGARFLDSDRIVMDAGDVLRTADAAPGATVVAVHLEALNHCPVTREELRRATRGRNVVVPDDGETVEL